MKIVILDGYTVNPGDLSWNQLREYGELTVYERTSPLEIIQRAKDAEIVLTNKVCLFREQIDALPNLRYIGVNATGYNVVDTGYARQHGIVVTNIPAYSTDSVAQSVFAHLLTVSNRVEHYTQLNRRGKWSEGLDFCYWNTSLFELSGKVLGIIGLGNIGQRVACIARAFGMDVFAYTSKHAVDLPSGIQKTTMEGLLAVSDVLTLHCPMTDATRHLINADSLSRMKQGAILINTGRGALVCENAVAKALENGQLSAYCADVLDKEPPSEDNPLLNCPNAYITPHIAWATIEARRRLIDIAIDNVRAYIKGVPVNVVN
ncbi:MAG: D-2-hydroxyacid dehydrogenase [Prevotella sp.]|nr:D-2-hydroxyacid dehydrogenase [Prevotella sp.]